MNNNELYHYGVLGMKWGVHRTKVNKNKAVLAKRAGDSVAEKKYASKANKIMNKHIKRSGKETVDRVSKMSTGKAVAQSCLFGTYGALKYNQVRAEGRSRGEAAVSGVLHEIGNAATSGWLGVVEPRLR